MCSSGASSPSAASGWWGSSAPPGITPWWRRAAPAAAEAIGAPGFDTLVLDLRAPDLDLARLREALAPARPAEPDSLEQAERRHIALALGHTGGNKRRAAQLLGISRSTLLHKVRKYRLEERGA